MTSTGSKSVKRNIQLTMKISSALFFILVFNGVFPQNGTDEFLEQSKIFQNKALWFNDMPQYNQDSSRYYFNKAIRCLDKNNLTHFEQLGRVYMDLIIYSTTMDQLDLNLWLYSQKPFPCLCQTLVKNYKQEYKCTRAFFTTNMD